MFVNSNDINSNLNSDQQYMRPGIGYYRGGNFSDFEKGTR